MHMDDEELWEKTLAFRQCLETYSSEIAALCTRLKEKRQQAAVSKDREAWRRYNALVSLLLTEEKHLAESSCKLVTELLDTARGPTPPLRLVK